MKATYKVTLTEGIPDRNDIRNDEEALRRWQHAQPHRATIEFTSESTDCSVHVSVGSASTHYMLGTSCLEGTISYEAAKNLHAVLSAMIDARYDV